MKLGLDMLDKSWDLNMPRDDSQSTQHLQFIHRSNGRIERVVVTYRTTYHLSLFKTALSCDQPHGMGSKG